MSTHMQWPHMYRHRSHSQCMICSFFTQTAIEQCLATGSHNSSAHFLSSSLSAYIRIIMHKQTQVQYAVQELYIPQVHVFMYHSKHTWVHVIVQWLVTLCYDIAHERRVVFRARDASRHGCLWNRLTTNLVCVFRPFMLNGRVLGP